MEIRVDRVYLPSVKRTKEGYLKGEAVVTRAGVFKYRNLDGTERLELRHPDDIFIQDSLDTLKAIPITNDHPRELVNADNVATLAVGMTGETIKLDQENVIVSVNITHKDAIRAVDRGKKEFSLGYTLEVVEEAGIYNGEKYTHRQKNITYNHLALVEQARAGRAARINLDGALVSINNEDENMNDEEKEKLQQRLDKTHAENDQLKQKIAELEATRTDSAINEKVKERIKIINKASSFVTNLDSLADKSKREIMELVVRTRYQDLRLDNKSDDYVEGRFDEIIESGSTAIARQLTQTVVMTKHSDTSSPEQKLMEALKSHYRN